MINTVSMFNTIAISLALFCVAPAMNSCAEKIERPNISGPLIPNQGPEGAEGSIGQAEIRQSTVFTAGPSGQTYRIPAIITTKDGSILVFAEDRHSSWRDKSYTDVIVKRSSDNGENWSGTRSITGAINDGSYAFMDPSPILDAETGKIFLFFNRWKVNNSNAVNNRAFLSVSEDNGVTWSVPEDVSGQILAEGMFCGGFGPGHGIQIKTGKYKGRLIVITRQFDGSHSHGYAIYSDDHGQTWQVSSQVLAGESQIAEAGEDKLYMNIRKGDTRTGSVSTDGGKNWTPAMADASLPFVAGGCEASVLGTGNNVVFYCGPGSGPAINGHDDRYDLKLFRSTSGASMWTKSQVIFKLASGYSDMTVLKDGKLAIIFEAGPDKGFIKTGGNARPVGWMRLDLIILPPEITSYDYWF